MKIKDVMITSFITHNVLSTQLNLENFILMCIQERENAGSLNGNAR